MPIGACYAGTLWVGNAAYLYLSVSFIQMLKVSRKILQSTAVWQSATAELGGTAVPRVL